MRFLAGLLVFLVLPAWCATSALVFHKTFGGSGNESIAAIASDPSGYVVFAGSTSSYDYPVTNGTSNTATHFAVTLDAGRTWSPLSNLPSGTPISLAVDTRTPATWYAGGTTGIFKSTDAGATWTATGSTGLSNCVFVAPVCGATALAINPAQPSIVYALTSNGIVKTEDSGASWNPVTPPVQGQNPPAYLGMDPLHPDHLFTAVAGMDFRSFDGGQSWTQYTPPLLDPNSHCSSWASPVAFDTRSPNTVYLVDHCDLFRSTDGGIYWSAISTPFTIAYAVVADPSQAGKLFVLSFDGLYGTTDGGASWSLLLPYTQGNPPPFVAFDPAQPPVVLAGAARSQDGGATWTPLALGRQPSTVVFDPQTPGRAIAATSGAPAAFVTKVDSSGAIQSSTYLGGQGGAAISGIATDPAGNIYVTGTTASRDFPVTPGALLTAPGGTTNSFVTKFDPALKLVYSTFLPVNGQSTSIAVDRNGSAAVTGILSSPSSPSACFVTRLTPDGRGVLFSERLGGSGGDSCRSVAADSAGNVIVAGTTFSRDFPLTGNGAATSFHGESDATVSKFDPSGKLIYSGYLGGTDSDSAAAIAVDGAGNIYVSGTTRSKDFPTTSGAYQTSLAAHCAYPSSSVATGFIGTITSYLMDDAFVTKLDATGNPVFSTYLGGDCYDVAGGMSVDASGNVWITGSTDSDPFPQLIPFQSGPQYAFYKSFVAELDAGGGVLRLASYIDSGEQRAAHRHGYQR